AQIALDASLLPERLNRAKPTPPPDAGATPKDKSGPSPLRRPPGATIGWSAPKALAPGQILTVPLYYPAPASTVAALHLELPAAALGLEGSFRFQIPRAMYASS